MKKHFIFLIRERSRRLVISGLIILCGVISCYKIAEPLYAGVFGPLNKTVIVIDPGHGGIDSGANSTGIMEKDINLDVAKKIQTYLKKTGAKVILTREADLSLENSVQTMSRHKMDLLARLNIINHTKPDFFISIHVNTSPRRPKTSGPMVFYNKRVPGAESLAQNLQSNLNSLAQKNGFQQHSEKAAEFFLLKNALSPGALVELGFLTNSKEKVMLKEMSYRNSIAKQIADSISQFCSSGGQRRSVPIDTKVSTDNFTPHQSSNTAGDIKTALIRALNDSSDGKVSTIPNEQAKILDVKLQNGIANINLSSGFVNQNTGGDYDKYLELRSIIETSCQFSDVNGVRILMNGQKAQMYGEQMDISRVLIPENPKLRVAFVIDDVASSNQGLQTILDLNRHITLAVLPKRPLTQEDVDLIHKKKMQMFLHLPMEAEVSKKSWLGEGAITSTTSPEKVSQIVLDDLQQVPYAVGINNHMGSKITKRRDLMIEVLRIAKAKKLVFLDSKTTEDSIVNEIAKEINMPILERSIFLDSVNSYGAICKQIGKLAEIAKKNGTAIAIGHVGVTGNNTSRALSDNIPWLEEQGIELVYATELMN